MRKTEEGKRTCCLFDWPIYKVPYVCCINSYFWESCACQAEWWEYLILSQGAYSFINYHWKLYRCLFSPQVPSPESRPWSDILHMLLHSLTGSGCNSLSASTKRERFISSCRQKIRLSLYKAFRSLFILQLEVILSYNLQTLFFSYYSSHCKEI